MQRSDENERTHRSAPTKGYTSRFDTTDALRLDTSRASLHYLTRLALTGTGTLSLNTIRATLL